MAWRPPGSDEMPDKARRARSPSRHWSAESPQQVWRRTRGTWDCRCEHEPQIRLGTRSSPVGRHRNPARRHGTDPRPGGRPGCTPRPGNGVRAHAGTTRRRAHGQGPVRHDHWRAGRPGAVAGRARGRPGRDGGDRGVLEAGLLRAGRPLPGVAVQRASRQERPGPQDGPVRCRVAGRRGRARDGAAQLRAAAPDPGTAGADALPQDPRSTSGRPRSPGWRRCSRTPGSSSPPWPPRS